MIRLIDVYRYFCLCEYKGADQLCSNCTTDQRLCFHFTNTPIPLLHTYNQNFKILALFCECTERFVSDLVGIPEDRFSGVVAHLMIRLIEFCRYLPY